jgi:hypothetical protein
MRGGGGAPISMPTDIWARSIPAARNGSMKSFFFIGKLYAEHLPFRKYLRNQFVVGLYTR